MIDVNVSFGQWPFQRFSIKTIGELVAHLKSEGIEQAMVSHLGCVFFADPDAYNRDLLRACRRHPEIHPVPVVNPHLNGWRDNLDVYLENDAVKAVKVIPSFHNYRLYSKPVFELIEVLNARGVQFMIQMRYEDERDRYFALNVYGPKVAQVVRLANRFPSTRMFCLNAYLPEARELGKATDNIAVDTAFAEWIRMMELLLEDMPAERIFLGTHTPLLVTRASVMKITRSVVSDAIKRRITHSNADQILNATGR